MHQTRIAIHADRTLTERKDLIVPLLQQGICEVTFTKVNGELRTMPCTLNSAIIPPAPAPKILAEGEVARTKKPNADNLSVWCTDKNEWRSFKLANVTLVESV
jgi:hypothetical protein